MTVGFFLSFCWVWTGLLGRGGTVDRQTDGWEVISHGGDGLVVVLVVDAGVEKNNALVSVVPLMVQVTQLCIFSTMALVTVIWDQ